MTAAGRLTVISAQLNPCMGDVPGNLALAEAAAAGARDLEADVVVLPELFLLGYPPEDLVLRPSAVAACRAAAEALAAETRHGPAVVIGAPWDDAGVLFNACLLLDGGEIRAVRPKHELPNYGVFDERRTFTPGPAPEPIDLRGWRLGIPICEDIWLETVPRTLKARGAELLLVPNGSPWRRGVRDERRAAIARWANLRLPLVFVNQWGGQDELVFDGASFALDADGHSVQQLPSFESAYGVSRWERTDRGLVCVEGATTPILTGLAEVWSAMTTGLRDYVQKSGFGGVVLGLSGGVDSAIVAAVAVDALGPDNVHCVMLPSRFTSPESLEDASDCASALGVSLLNIPISDAVDAFGVSLAGAFEGRKPDATEENIQSRVRGVTLMALSNKFGWMVVTTGNKSEMAVGYATLYGDMCGGYNPIKDLYKTEVYELARWRNAHHAAGLKGPRGRVIPERILTKAPTAELKPDQKDQDTLPEYSILDDILRGLVEDEADVHEIARRGHGLTVVRRVEGMLRNAEYKRRQAAPGLKVGRKAFGRDRRYPLANRWRD